MIISNRRDAGYTIISRFEESFRKLISSKISQAYSDFFEAIPEAIINKAQDRTRQVTIKDLSDLLENSDFPDLKEITTYKSNFSLITEGKIDKVEFISSMDDLYLLRCKIAHVKGFFTSIDLDKLIELTTLVANIFIDFGFLELIGAINKNPNEVIIKIPSDFSVDYLQQSGILNNVPIPDYEYEGGFVGREHDRKRIIQYLLSEKFPVITITGAGGVGKTSLALRIIQELTQNPSQKKFDAIIWLSAKENRLTAIGIEDIEPTLKSYEELLDTIIEVMDFDDENDGNVEEKEKLVNQILELSNKVIIIIDNLETITDQRILNFIIEAPINIKFLITSRRGIGQIEIRHEVKQLKEKEAIYLFRQLAKDKQLQSLLSLPDDTIKSYVEKVSFYPLAIKWVIGQIARGKDINRVISLIKDTESDISRFCFEQIFNSLSADCKNILYAVCCFDENPTSSVLQYVVEQSDDTFDKSIEELILVSLIIPEQFQNEKNSISRKFSILSLTKGYIRLQLNKFAKIKEYIVKRIIDVENTITITEKAKREYRHSLHNLGAKTDEEKVAAILAQTAFQKYQAGRYDEAIDDYKKAIKIAPNFSAIYRNWSVMESYEGHLQEADRLMEEAERLNDRDPQIYLLWGNILRKNAKYHEALKKYEKAYNLDNEDHIILNALGTTKSKLGEYEQAYEYLKKALVTKLSIDSTKHEIINKTSIAENLINWADSLIKDRSYTDAEIKLDEAITHLLELLEIGAKDSMIFTALSKANLKKGKLFLRINRRHLAIDSFVAVFTSTPKTFKHHFYRIIAGVELAEISLETNHIGKARYYIRQIELDYKGSPILRRPDAQAIYSRFNEMRSRLSESNKVKGKITIVDLSYNYIIVKDENESETYIADNSDFIPRLSSLSKELLNKNVYFTPAEKPTRKGIRKVAKFIKII